jgi:flagellar motor protein MotB
LAFFIMLASMSSGGEHKQFQPMVAILQEQFGHTPPRGEVEKNLVVAACDDEVPDARKLGRILPGRIIRFAEQATALTEDNKRRLHQFVGQLQESDAVIEIRGHAAQGAIDPQSGIRDAWDLADRRCYSTMAFLVEQGIEPSRLRLANAGVSEPLYNGADTMRLRENSRVEIRLKRDGMDGY